LRFVDELLARIDRAGAPGEKLFRGRLGSLERQAHDPPAAGRLATPISVRRQPSIKNAITTIGESAWQPLADYPETHPRRDGIPPAGRQPNPALGRRDHRCRKPPGTDARRSLI